LGLTSTRDEPSAALVKISRSPEKVDAKTSSPGDKTARKATAEPGTEQVRSAARIDNTRRIVATSRIGTTPRH
jgi:hypothetical protein